MRNDNGVGRRNEIVKLIRHELNTPLATALLYIGIAEGSAAQLPEGIVKSSLRVARSEVQRLKSLIDTLTELECAGHATVRPRAIDVGETVRNTVERLLAVRDAAKIRVVALGELRGWWDRSMVEQIVGNLLSNAVKFGQGRPIRIAVTPAEYGVYIAVRDHGVGVPAADQDWIFERNAHVSAELGGGLGLGLWLVRELAAAHGGWVTLESRKGRGSTFTVFLRAQRPRMVDGGMAVASATPPAAPVELRESYWQERVVRSQRKTPLLARRVTVDPVVGGSTMTSPSLTGSLNASVPSKTRKSIEELTL